MDIFAPPYYKNFKCIADKCTHSCCIGWEIDIDPKAAAKYAEIRGALGDKIRASIAESEDGKYIKMEKNGHCPFLNRGLCEIISTLGDGYICEICREHPRFYNRVGNRLEVGLGISCEEAARLVLRAKGIGVLEKIGETADAENTEYSALKERDCLLQILSDESLGYCEKVSEIEEKFKVYASRLDEEKIKEIYSALEYLDNSHKEVILSSKPSCTPSLDAALTAFLAYTIYRHVSVATDFDNLRARLGFCLLSSRVLEGMASGRENPSAEIVDCARIYSEEIEYSEDNTAALIFEFEIIL